MFNSQIGNVVLVESKLYQNYTNSVKLYNFDYSCALKAEDYLRPKIDLILLILHVPFLISSDSCSTSLTENQLMSVCLLRINYQFER